MKSLITFFCAFVLFSNTSNAQCAIAVCDYTGIWGAYYDDGNPPFLSMYQTEVEALKSCKNYGGLDCQTYWTIDCSDCWVAFLISTDGNSVNYIGGYSYTSKSDVESQVRNRYREGGGLAPNSAIVTSWYMP